MVRLFKPNLFQMIAVGSGLVILGLVFWLFVWPMINGGQATPKSLAQKTVGPIQRAKDLVKENKCDEAVAVLEDATTRAADSSEKAEYYRSQASILAECGKLDQALEVAEKADAVKPKDTPISDTSEDEYKKVLKTTYEDVVSTKKVVSASSDEPDTYEEVTSTAEDLHHLAYLYELVGDYSSAVDHYKQCLEIYKKNPTLDESGQSQYIEGRISALENRQ